MGSNEFMATLIVKSVLFAPTEVRKQQLHLLVTKPFSQSTKKSSTFTDHKKLAYHQDSIARMSTF